MIKQLWTFFSLLFVLQSYGQVDTTTTDTAHHKGFFRPLYAVKYTPAFQSFPEFHFMGGNVHFETGLKWQNVTLDISFRYFRGADTTNVPENYAYNIPQHYRLDIEPRFWLYKSFYQLSAGPVLSVYHTLDIAGGLSFHLLSPLDFKKPLNNNYFFLEPGIGIYTTSIETYSTNPPIVLRYILSFGYYWNRSKQR